MYIENLVLELMHMCIHKMICTYTYIIIYVAIPKFRNDLAETTNRLKIFGKLDNRTAIDEEKGGDATT